MTRMYEVTIRPIGREHFDLAAAYAAAVAPSAEGDYGQIGAFWRWTATVKPELPAPPMGVRVQGWTWGLGAASGGESFYPA